MKIKFKKPKIRRINLNRQLRFSIIAVLILLIVGSSYTVFSATKEETTVETTPVYSYTHMGKYDYEVYLKDNNLYSSNVLKPGQGTIFKKLIDKINMSYTYEFQATTPSEIKGSYKIDTQIQTGQWSKEFNLEPSTAFNSDTNLATFTVDFPLNTTKYEDFVKTINDQTGVLAQDPTLIIKTTVLLSSEFTNESINEVFQQSIQIPLGTNVLELNGNLSQSRADSIVEEEIITKENDNNQTGFTSLSIVLSLTLVGFVGITKSEKFPELLKRINKIDKKYGEWIVNIEEPPVFDNNMEKIKTKSFEDLIKISEETGKPVIHYESASSKTHTYHVVDENIHYEYLLSYNRIIKKTVRCPGCKTQITVEGKSDESVKIECPKCGKKGKITI